MESSVELRPKRKFFNETNLLILAAIVPCIAFYIIFAGVPMIYALYLSFHKWSFTTPPQWVGTANFVKVFTGDKIFYKALKNTLYYAWK